MVADIVKFKRVVLAYWRNHGRHDLPWRKTTDPYSILVSEVMLQQTQVDRVIPFYEFFMKRFPSAEVLARARPASVLRVWQGLGYNRRALMLQRCARDIVSRHSGMLPDSIEGLQKLPGIGPYTAGAVLAFAFNKAYPIIETNIRRVYIHHFFSRKKRVDDRDLLLLVAKTLDKDDPRRWYSALMDYGSWLAEQTTNPNRKSRQHIRQSRFEGSDRQVRGVILRHVLALKNISERRLARMLDMPKERFSDILQALIREGFLKRVGRRVRCA